ncbi:MAG: flagellar FliJ family protein [Leptospiraceae bacterium]|nr:flagellar FliJ family protein [Leptospiraceae bacterium]
MKKFKFKLETVHNLRKRKVEHEIRNLSVVVGHINKLSNEIKENKAEITKTTGSFSSIVGGDLNYLRIFDSYVKGLNLQNEYLERQINEKEEELNDARDKLIHARKEAEVIEIIRKNRYKEFYDKMLRMERTEEDEANLKDVVEDRRGLHKDESREQVKPAEKVERKIRPRKKGPQNDYEKVMDYYENLKQQSR